MEVTKKMKIRLCDSCKTQGKSLVNFMTICLSCGKEYCYDCREKLGREFNCGVHFSGGDDGYFCNSCISKPKDSILPLLNSYIRIESLRQEALSMWNSFDERRKKTENEVKLLVAKFKK